MSVDVKTLQTQIITWIRVRNTCSVSQLTVACKRLVEPYGDDLPHSFHPIYWLVFPLLRLGVLEYAIEDAGVVVFGARKEKFVLNDGAIIQCSDEKNLARFHAVKNLESDVIQEFHPLELLESFPTVQSIIEDFPAYSSTIERFDFSRNLRNLKLEPHDRSNGYGVGLYKQKDYPYVPYCLILESGDRKKVPSMAQDIDALNYASCYVLIKSVSNILIYNKKNCRLFVSFPLFLPIFISRALIQFSPQKLLGSEVYEKTICEYDNIPLQAIAELKRIFSDKSVEVVND